jgi:Caspase domain
MSSTVRIVFALITLILSASVGAAQDVRKHKIGSRAAAFQGQIGAEVESTPGSAEARSVVEAIVRKTGTAMNFEVRAAPAVINAMAETQTVDGKQVRTILYNPAWMADLQRTVGSSWFNTSILAHEIGHHLNGHLDPDYGNHKAELEADKYSGFILQKLGASREQAVLPMAMIGTDEPSATHPARAKRVEEVGRGWDDAAGGQGANIIRPSEPAGPRVALLIGNSDYRHVPKVKNSKNDVLALQRELKRLGFVTTTVHDATADQITSEINRFQEHAQDADWAIFYYGGQGVEIDGVNYMAPIDATGKDTATLSRLDTAFEAVRHARTVRLVITDACRNDPISQQLSGSKRLPGSSLKVVEPPRGIVVAYSTRAGQIALDGFGDNSPYTEALVAALKTPGIELDKVFRRAREHVFKVTNGVQEPTVLGDWPAQELYIAR